MHPSHIEYSENKGVLSVFFDWYQPILVGVFLFSIIINALIFNYFVQILFSHDPIFKIIGIAIGLSTFVPQIYLMLCFYFNKTYIQVDATHLSIQHTPIPWWRGNKELFTQDIEQIFLVEKTRKKGVNNYIVKARMVDGNDEVLLNLGLKADQLKEFEKRLEAHIGIRNAPIIGEYTP